MHRKSEAGFTLIELLIVVTVIGILAGTLIPGLVDKLNQAKYSAAAYEMRLVMDHWVGITPQLPAPADFARTGEPLDVDSKFPLTVEARELEELFEIEVPERDPWGQLYEYRVDAFPSRCLLIRTKGGDGQWDSTRYISGTLIPVNDRRSDLVMIDRRWIQRWDPVWRGQVPIIPVARPPLPPRILPPML
ncbi:MAG: type II secretion system protein [Thermoanaerobaculia bacterium]|nr:type II secretion system protein [Thermoanaerobaculia bacterium]